MVVSFFILFIVLNTEIIYLFFSMQFHTFVSDTIYLYLQFISTLMLISCMLHMLVGELSIGCSRVSLLYLWTFCPAQESTSLLTVYQRWATLGLLLADLPRATILAAGHSWCRHGVSATPILFSSTTWSPSEATNTKYYSICCHPISDGLLQGLALMQDWNKIYSVSVRHI
jgi:hypothetical protein